MNRHVPLLVASALVVASCDLVAPTNPFDPATDPANRRKAQMTGTVTATDGRATAGATVTVRVAGALDVTAAVTDTGTYALEADAGEAEITAELAGLAAGPVTRALVPGDVVSVDLLLAPGAPTSTVRGVVAATAPIQAAGADVSLVEVTADDACLAALAQAKVATDGSYAFTAVRPGRFRVFAAAVGARTALSAPFDVQKDAAVVAPALVLAAIGDDVRLVEDGAPVAATRAPAVTVEVAAQDGLDGLVIGFSATFDPALGGPGLVPFAPSTTLPLPAAEGPTSVFVKLVGACGESAVYEARIVLDRAPPLVLGAALNGVALVADRAVTVVLRDAAATARFTAGGLDDSGVDALLVTGDAPFGTSLALPGGQFSVAADVPLPAAEGTYALTFALRDAAGNLSSAPLLSAVVVRDREAPRTPIPVAASVDTFGPTAALWLEPRVDCPAGREPFSCEAVPPTDRPLFELQGGRLVDFTAVAGPPFMVEVEPDATTRFVVRARDAAGNTSTPATIEVIRPQVRERFRLAGDRQFGQTLVGVEPNALPGLNVQRAMLDEPAQPPLSVSGGQAFFTVRPTPGRAHATSYSVMLAQPADIGSVGLLPSVSLLPTAIRRLSYDHQDPLISNRRYVRVAGGIGAGGGRLSWLEFTGDSSGDAFPRQYVLALDADGRFDLAGADRAFRSARVDDDGELTVARATVGATTFARNVLCQVAGPARCARDAFAWRGLLTTSAPTTAAVEGTRIAVPGTSVREVTFANASPVAAAPIVLDGSSTSHTLIGAVLRRRTTSISVNAVRLALDVPAGTPLVTMSLREASGTLTQTTGANVANDALVSFASGAGVETLPVPISTFTGNSNALLFVGVAVPPGVAASMPTIAIEDVAEPSDFAFIPLGVVSRSAASLDDLASLPVATPTDGSRFPSLTVLIPAVATGGAPVVSGLVATELGSDGEPEGIAIPGSVAAVRADAIREEKTSLLPVVAPGTIDVASAANETLVVPTATQVCAVVVRPLRDTPLESLSVEGFGLLDSLTARVFRSSDGKDSGLFTRDIADFPSDIFFRSPNEDSCDEEQVGTPRIVQSYSRSVSPFAVLLDDVEQIVIPDDGRVDAPYSVPLGDTAEVTTFNVTPGQFVKFSARSTDRDPDNGQDPDLLVEFDNGDSFRSERFGIDEESFAFVPDDATSVTLSVIAFGKPCIGTASIEVLPELIQVAQFPVAAGAERVEVSMFGPAPQIADVAMLARFDADPTLETFDCRDDGSRDVCTFTPVPAGAQRIHVAAVLEPFFAFVGDPLRAFTLQDAGFADRAVDSLAVADTEVVSITMTGVRFDGPALIVTFFDADDDEVDTEVLTGSDDPERVPELSVPVPGGAVRMALSLRPGSVRGDAQIDVSISTRGCSAVSSRRDGSSQILRGGETYAVVVHGSITGGRFGWTLPPASAPAIATGAPLPSPSEDLELIGAVSSVGSINANQIVVPSVGAGQQCRVTIQAQRRVTVTMPAISQTTAAAVLIDNGVERVAVADLAQTRPELTTAFELDRGDRTLALAVAEIDGAAALRAVISSPASLRVLERSAAPAVDDLCELLEEAFVVSAATIADDRLVVAGTGPQGPVVRVYALADTDRCAAATLLVERRVAATPIAVSAEGDDVFFIAGVDQTNSGGALFHLDLRDVELLLPAGAREVTGAARAAAAVVVSMAPRVSGGGGLLVIDTGSGAARELAGAQTTFQPAVVSSSVAGRDVQVAVSVDVDAVAGAKPRLVARALDGSVTASLDAALVAQGPGFDVLDARRFARDPIIAAADDRLAVLGYDGAGRRTLDVLTLAGTAEVGRVTLEGTLPDGALALDVIGDVVVVGFEGDGRAFLIDAGALSEVTVGDDEAIVGAASDALVVAISAGDLLVAKPPSTMRLVRRDPRGVLDDVDLGERLPSALFGRAFARVIDDGDGVRVYDQQADPPVAWRLKPGGLALPLDGALRPLASAMPRLGRSAASADLLVRETATGAALYRQR